MFRAISELGIVDQAGTTVKPGKQEIIDIDDTFCAAHGGQQLVFWNAHHDERGFASMQSRGKPMVTRNERSASFRCNAQIRARSEVQRTYRKRVGAGSRRE